VCPVCFFVSVSISVCVYVGETCHVTNAQCPRNNHNPACARALFILKPRPGETPLTEFLHSRKHTLIAHVHT
jgi:hypothetical protein